MALCAVLLLCQGWYNVGYFPFAMFGFVPVFLLEHKIRTEQPNRNLWLVIYGFLIFFLWNVGSIWWIWNATVWGAVAAFFINALPMILPLLLYSNYNYKFNKENKWVFITAWLSLEYLQFYWDFAFPWLILGNAFANHTNFVQWYEYTGVIGGSLFILLNSHYSSKVLRNYNFTTKRQRINSLFNILYVGVFAPLALSYFIKNKYVQQLSADKPNAEFIIVQPNINPYSEKFGSMSPMAQLNIMLQLVQTKISNKTSFIVLPETALQGGLYENNIENEPLIIAIKTFLKQYPNVGVITGADSYYVYAENEKKSATARMANNNTIAYDAFNTALYITTNNPVKIYHKNKLVPGVEKMPYPAMFKFLEKYAIGLGGTSGSLGSSGSSMVFNTNQNLNLAPIICYESAFAAFTASTIKNNADAIVVITNDGWWGDTPGYKQHLSFAKLRAIENRKFVVRSANTGISCYINPLGVIEMQTKWWQKDIIAAKVHKTGIKTFYTKYGDYLATISVILLGFYCLNYLLLKKETFNT